MKKTWAIVVLLSIVLLQRSYSQNAFPGAEGFGSDSRCAYAADEPKILIVNTLESGSHTTSPNSGSLAWCINQVGPRIILFNISGVIELPDLLTISNPYLNIYGQTAPGQGIIIKGATLNIVTHDVLIQHLKFRSGNDPVGTEYDSRDALKIKSGAKNIIIDHCDMMWATDENLEIYRYNISNITISNCLIAEGLYNSGHSDSPHSMNVLGQGIENVSIVKTIMTNSENRCPFVRESKTEIINCLMYNAHWQTIDMGCDSETDIIGCVSKSGPNSTETTQYIGRTRNDGCSSDMRQLVYVEDNKYENKTDSDGIYNPTSYNINSASRLVKSNKVNIITSASTENNLLVNAGAMNWKRDITSQRVINDIKNKTGGYINNPYEKEGYSWIMSETRDITSVQGYPNNPHQDDNKNGFTNLEDWVASFSGKIYRNLTIHITNSVTNLSISGASVEVPGYSVRLTNLSGNVSYEGILDSTLLSYSVTKEGYSSISGSITVNSDVTVSKSLTPAPDIIPPTPPRNLIASPISSNQVDLAWEASTDNVGVAGYIIYRDGVEIGKISELNYSDHNAPPNIPCQYEVTAYDLAKNESEKSNTITVTTFSDNDTSAPSIPQNIIAVATSSTMVSLSWSASNDNKGVVGYNIFRNDEFIGTVTSITFNDTGLQPETEYAYSVKALDQADNESAMSERVTVSTLDPAKIVYINPESNNVLAPDGSIESPFTSWTQVEWREGYEYRQLRNTVCIEPKILITENDITIGSYGTGERPKIVSTSDDYAVSIFDKKNITISEVDIEAEGAIGGLYFAGTTNDSNTIERCKIIGSEFCIRIAGGNNFIISYNELRAQADAIYILNGKCKIYYNEFTNTETAININDYSSKVEIYNNVFFSNLMAISSSYGEIIVYNNIFSLDISGSVAISQELDSLMSDHNIFYPARSGFINIGNIMYNDLSTYQFEQQKDLNSKIANPLFIDPQSGDFRVENQSPGIEAGIDIGLTVDRFGSPVPYGNYPDIGIQESDQVVTDLLNNSVFKDVINLFPNPNNGEFTVQLADRDDYSNIDVTIVDLLGKKVYTEKSQKGSILNFHLAYLLPGEYIFKLEKEDGSSSKVFSILQ